MRPQKVKQHFRTILLGSSLMMLTACAAWKSSGQDNASAIIDGDTHYASNAQPLGLGEEDSIQNDSVQNDLASHDHDLSKRTYYFAFDRSEVRAGDVPAIEANAEYLASHPNAKVLIEGHTDPRGSREYNIALGERRAKAVMRILKGKGVSPSQIRLISYGAEKLASNGRTDSDYQLDRRDILVYLQR